ncbi:MAG: O-methyltransferase [Lachnospiraceae bacterium]|nr:O-methyltransferase [Lachnospiraceae bacterium]
MNQRKPDYLEKIEKRANDDGVPIIRTQAQSLLHLLLTIKGPKRILEVGTAVGFSTLLMREYAPDGCTIVTIERDERMIVAAKENFLEFDKSKVISLLEGEALEILKGLTGEFDFIFMDAAKGQYLGFLPEVIRLLADGGVLVSDNVLQEGEILESRFAVTRRNRTIHSRMREYLYELKHRNDLCTDILPVADGVAVSCKINI